MNGHRWLFLFLFLTTATAWGQTVSPEMVGLTVRSHLQGALDQMNQGYSILEVQSRNAFQVPDGELSMELTLHPDELAPGVRLTVPVTLLINGKAEAATTVTVKLKQRQKMVVTRQSIHKGETLHAGMLEVRESEMTTATGDVVLADRLSSLIGKAANRQIREGQPLRMEWLEEPLAVTRGEKIRVSIQEKGLTIETTAVAESPGKVGEIIQVRNMKSNRRFPVRLVAPGAGKVELL
ncbi:MAG: flagellar basal body P-ring formation protein FlgA [Magnetococcales bacterium]|nr:flagellar basal body P-ring formation protein FlgA [Magnetococcales bacterium]NGZ25282.1 flagellar basal body P-ring formation protein FlgA [Magnetococcales bacterium]